MTRPAGKVGNTGIEWRGWFMSAQTSLIWACSDDDPRCVQVAADEAIESARFGLEAAMNSRQVTALEILIKSATEVKRKAIEDPDTM